jgi:tetratricopeptide (TPR) repeat protein
MLSAAGINADAVLIGAGIRFNTAVPSPGAFNHLITRAMVGGQPVWLDSTAEVAPYRMLVSVIRDKQALLVPGTGVAHLDRSPADLPFANYQTMDAVGTLDKDGISHSRLTFVFRGDGELVIRSAFRQIAPAQYNEMVQQISQGIGYAGTTSNPEISKPEDTTEPFKMSYDYEREKAGDWDNYRIIPQVSPVSLPRFQDSDPLVRSLELGTPGVETSSSAMKLPEGWGVVLPEAVHLKCAYASYDETYRFESGTVYAKRRVEVLKQKVPVADLKVYKKWADDADLGNEKYIQLTRPPAAQSGSGAAEPKASSSDTGTPAASDEARALNLIQSAYAEIGSGDLDGAKQKLDEAGKLSPDHEYFWNTSGYLAMKRGDPQEAVLDYKKEIALHPSAYQRMYPVIANTQLLLSQRKEAMDTLRAWAAADPANPKPVTMLMGLLIEDGDVKSAASTGEAAAPQISVNADGTLGFHIALGKAQLDAGEAEKGKATLEALLKDADTADALNDAAYELADAGLDLPLAERSARAALDKLTAESDAWTLDENQQILHDKTRLILATWDTLGWILFKESRLEEAESYLRAAWLGMLNLDTGKHLGDALAARGDKSAALSAYELAVGTVPGYDAMGVRTPPGPKEKEVQALAAALRRAGVKSTATTPQNSLLALRTVPLGAANGRSGDAEYRLLLKDGKAVKAEAAGAKAVSGALDMIAKVNFSGYFPAGSQAALMRVAYVNCHSGVCELVLEP